MQYREFGKTGKMVSAVGMGANRFPSDMVNTADGMERCAEIMVKAASAGINFYDSAATYSGGKCEEILKLALKRIESRCYICGKSSSHQERTRDSVLKYIEKSLKNIGIEFFDFYYMWSVKSLEQYKFIMSKGGAYEGLLAAKERGLIKHICFSSHASPQDTVKIIEDDVFEGVLVSYSLLNFREYQHVLQAAKRNGLGTAVMNPLGGGMIPQNKEIFEGASMDGDIDIVDSALKFVYANPAVDTILCGISQSSELDFDVHSLGSKDSHEKMRQSYAAKYLKTFHEFCTGCDYCINCPAGIPVSALMKAYNQTKFRTESFIYNRSARELISHGNLFRKLEGAFSFPNTINPCVNCGKCESVCTQSLPIRNTIRKIYDWAAKHCISDTDRKERLQRLIGSDYSKVGLYTAGVYTSFVIQLYKQLIGLPDFKIYVFDTNPTKWGDIYLDEFIIRDPKEIADLNLDVLLISNYIHSDTIYNELTMRFSDLNIQKLHEDNDLPWMF